MDCASAGYGEPGPVQCNREQQCPEFPGDDGLRVHGRAHLLEQSEPWPCNLHLERKRRFESLSVHKWDIQTTPVSQSTVLEAEGYSNSVPLSLSANGNQEGTGIVWGSGAFSANANRNTVAGILRAFDATDLTKELWDSKQNAARDDVGNYAKFSPPTIANGKVYLATFSNQLVVYGLLRISAQPPRRPVSRSSWDSLLRRPLRWPRRMASTASYTDMPAGLPSGVTCSFVPPSVIPGSAPATSTLTIATSATTPSGLPT